MPHRPLAPADAAARRPFAIAGHHGIELQHGGTRHVLRKLSARYPLGAQPKAGNIAGCITVCAEVNTAAAKKRYEQGWVDELTENIDDLIEVAKKCGDKLNINLFNQSSSEAIFSNDEKIFSIAEAIPVFVQKRA